MVLSKTSQIRATNAQKGMQGTTTIFALTSAILGKKVAVRKYRNANYNKTDTEEKVLRTSHDHADGGKIVQWKVEAREKISGHEVGQVYTIRRQNTFLSMPTENHQTTIAIF